MEQWLFYQTHYIFKFNLKYTNTRWDVALPRRSMGAFNPMPPPVDYYFFFFLILLVSNDFCFVYVLVMGNFSLFDYFPCILECLFFLLFLVKGGGPWKFWTMPKQYQYHARTICQNFLLTSCFLKYNDNLNFIYQLKYLYVSMNALELMSNPI